MNYGKYGECFEDERRNGLIDIGRGGLKRCVFHDDKKFSVVVFYKIISKL